MVNSSAFLPHQHVSFDDDDDGRHFVTGRMNPSFSSAVPLLWRRFVDCCHCRCSWACRSSVAKMTCLDDVARSHWGSRLARFESLFVDYY